MNIRINTAYIKTLDPCQDRFDNWKKHYDNFDLSLSEFLDLSQITHRDKLWVFFRSIPKHQIPLVAADFAEQVLHFYENTYPNDNRVKEAIRMARVKNIDLNNSIDAAPHAVRAAYASVYAAARAANAAAHSAYNDSAHDAAFAAHAAVRAAYAFNAAAYGFNAAAHGFDAAIYVADADAHAAPHAVDSMCKKQIEIMKKYA